MRGEIGDGVVGDFIFVVAPVFPGVILYGVERLLYSALIPQSQSRQFTQRVKKIQNVNRPLSREGR